MDLEELKPKIDTKEELLESYTDFKKRYYIYRVDDIVDYLQRDNSELDKLHQKEKTMYDDLKTNLTPEKQQVLLQYSDNWLDLINKENASSIAIPALTSNVI